VSRVFAVLRSEGIIMEHRMTCSSLWTYIRKFMPDH